MARKTLVSAELLGSLGLVPEALEPSQAPRQSSRSSGVEGNLYLCVRDRETLARVKPEARTLLAEMNAARTGGTVVYALAPKPGVDAAVRAFFPGYGVDEDPVTGSAAGQLALLLQETRPEIMPRKLVFTQGTELGREGRVEIEVRPEPTPGQVRAFIGGDTTVLLRGELDVPKRVL